MGRPRQAFKRRKIVRDSTGRIIHARVSFHGSLKAFNERIGGAQEAADKEFQRWVMAYVPLKSGTLRDSVPGFTHVGTGNIVVGAAYGHYQNFLTRPYKTPGIEERYASMPDRGPQFIERAITDHTDDVVAAAQKSLNSGGDM